MSRLPVSTRLTRIAAVLSIVAPPVVAAPAGAQQVPPATAPARRDSVSLPFRGGQWGMDFGIGVGGVYRIGAVRFTSPTRAWILDGRVSGAIERRELLLAPGDTVPLGYSEDRIQQGGSASLLVGRRAYRPIGARAMRTMSFGVGGGFGYDESLAEGRRTRSGVSSNATARFALGGHYRVTPSLALGASLGLGAQYTWAENDGPFGRVRSQSFGAGVETSELTLSLFF